MTVEKLQEFIPNLLSKLFIEALIYGNVTKQVRKEKFGTHTDLSQIMKKLNGNGKEGWGGCNKCIIVHTSSIL